jgi:hypothetical protein
MKYIKYYKAIALIMICITSCQKVDYNDTSFAESAGSPANLSMSFAISNDNTGKVDILPNGEGISSYEIEFGDGTPSSVIISPGKNVAHNYKEGNYEVKLIGHSISGKTTEITKSLSVTFREPENLEVNATLDPANNHRIIVSASALYASHYDVYFGDISNESPKRMLEGQPISHTYDERGTYTIRVIAQSGGIAKTEVTKTITISSPLTIPIDFESSSVNYSFFNFDGGASEKIDNPHQSGINTSAKVARMIKYQGQPWGGSILLLDEAIDFSSSKTFKVKVWSPKVGGKLLLKVENRTNSDINYEKEATTTVANDWEELKFDFSTIDTNNEYHNLVLIFDLGTSGDGTANFTYYFDDIHLTN